LSVPEPILPLTEVIHSLHGCHGVWIGSVQVTEEFNGATVWDGEVQVFDLPNCARAPRCYAWSQDLDGSNRRRFFAVLHRAMVDSPAAAVRTAVVGGIRQRQADGDEPSGLDQR
jgi:hypothetical protein